VGHSERFKFKFARVRNYPGILGQAAAIGTRCATFVQVEQFVRFKMFVLKLKTKLENGLRGPFAFASFGDAHCDGISYLFNLQSGDFFVFTKNSLHRSFE
jgi:hypothetical protein